APPRAAGPAGAQAEGQEAEAYAPAEAGPDADRAARAGDRAQGGARRRPRTPDRRGLDRRRPPVRASCRPRRPRRPPRALGEPPGGGPGLGLWIVRHTSVTVAATVALGAARLPASSSRRPDTAAAAGPVRTGRARGWLAPEELERLRVGRQGEDLLPAAPAQRDQQHLLDVQLPAEASTARPVHGDGMVAVRE